MPWTPTLQVFDSKPIIDKTLDYFESNQTDALTWAVNGGDALPDIQKFFNSARVATVFPTLMVIQSSHRQIVEDRLAVELRILFETSVQDGVPERAASNARQYETAIVSMLRNMPKTTLENNSIIDFNMQVGEIFSEFDVLRTNGKHRYLQIFQTEAQIFFEASGYA